MGIIRTYKPKVVNVKKLEVYLSKATNKAKRNGKN